MEGKGREGSGGRSREGKKALSGTFGRYEILDVVDHGAMGTVYRARHKAMENILALKILHPRFSKNPKFIDRFISEAKSCGRLSHPNVVRGIDAGEVDGRHFFAMEFVDGPALDEILATGGRLPENRALKITHDMARALGHAWENNIVHRDIKPGNILVGRDGRAKLTDLGLAVRLDTDGGKSGVTMGTPDYISPEQVRALPDVDIRSDIYSLGVTLFHMLTGHAPFSGDMDTVMGKQLTQDLPEVSEEVPDISFSTVRILKKMTRKRREERYASPLDLQEDLERAMAGEDVVVAQAGRALASRRLRRKGRFNLGIAGILMTVILFLGVVALQFLGNGTSENGAKRPKRSDPDGRTSNRWEPDSLSATEEEIRRAEEALVKAREFRAAHPDDFDGVIKKFQDVIRDHGQDWAEVCLREIEKIKKTREKRAWEAVEKIIREGDKFALEERFGEARRPIEAFLAENRKRFGPTESYAKGEEFLKEIRERTDRAVRRLEEQARDRMGKGKFDEAKGAIRRIERIDPDEFGSMVKALLRETSRAEEKAREAEVERKDWALLRETRKKAVRLVRNWKHREAEEALLSVRAEAKSSKVRAAASRELEELDRYKAFLDALEKAGGAVGKEMSIQGRTGRVVEVSKGFVHLEIGRYKAGFRLRELTLDETVRLAEIGLDLNDPGVKRNFAAYLLYRGKMDRARDILSSLNLPEEEWEYYREKLG